MKEYEGSNADSSCVSVYVCTCVYEGVEYERSNADRSCVSLYVHVYMKE